MPGKLRVIVGPMFSGKTTQLVHDIDRYWRAGKRCVIIKHTSDTRFAADARIITHDEHEVASRIPTILAADLCDPEVRDCLASAEVIGIDEVQFFTSYLFAELTSASIMHTVDAIEAQVLDGKVVICGGLDTDYRRVPFTLPLVLISRAHEVVKLLAVCANCGADAMCSARIQPAREYSQSAIGGCDKYAALCLACFLRNAA